MRWTYVDASGCEWQVNVKFPVHIMDRDTYYQNKNALKDLSRMIDDVDARLYKLRKRKKKTKKVQDLKDLYARLCAEREAIERALEPVFVALDLAAAEEFFAGRAKKNEA